MPFLIPLLIKALLPVAVQTAAEKLKGTETIKPEVVVMGSIVSGVLGSKTMWAAFIIAILGVVQQYSGILTAIIGEGKTGVVMTVIAAVMAVLRAVTTDSLTDKGQK